MTKMEQTDQTKNLLYVIIGILVVVVLGLGAMMFNGKKEIPVNIGTATTTSTGSAVGDGSNLKVTIISDKRCKSCPPITQIIAQVKNIPFLAKAEYTGKDFADAGVAEYLKNNKLTILPAFVLSSNNVGDAKFKEFLMPVANNEFAVKPEVSGGNYDPFAKRSDKGYLLMDADIYSQIKADSYTSGKKDAKFTWLEYSDLQCPFCAKFHKSDAWSEVSKKYGDSINKIFNHFPLSFHENAKPAALIAECLGAQKWSDAFYSLIQKSYADAKESAQWADTSESSSKDFLVKTAVSLGADKAKLEKCVADKTFDKKIDDQAAKGSKNFGVTGTPGVVIVNNATGEYEVVVWAQPKEAFLTVLEGFTK